MPSHARERSGRGGGDGSGGKRERRGKGRRAAPGSHRAAGPPALAHLDVISAPSVCSHCPILKRNLWPHPRLRGPSLAGAAQAQKRSGHRHRRRRRLHLSACTPPRFRDRRFTEEFSCEKVRKLFFLRGSWLLPKVLSSLLEKL